MHKLTLILGGARSGKSTYALKRVQDRDASVLFVATAEAHDDDMSQRINAHRLERPLHWETMEEPVELGSRLKHLTSLSNQDNKPDFIIIDCLTLWASNVLFLDDNMDKASTALDSRASSLIEIMSATTAHWIVVSNEVGLGLIPHDRLSRVYRDLLGRLNQRFAQVADEVIMMVAGIPVTVKSTQP